MSTLGVAAALLSVQPALAYQVQRNDTLWAISQRTGVAVNQLAEANHLADPNLIYAGQQLTIPAPPAPVVIDSPSTAPTMTRYQVKSGDTLWGISRQAGISLGELRSANDQVGERIFPGQTLLIPGTAAASAQSSGVTREQGRALVAAAARRHGLEPAWVLAIAHWESGFQQGVRSSTGAIGLMQVEPATGTWASQLAGRKLDLNSPTDNVEAGAVVLRRYLDEFHGDQRLALAAYYQGATGTRKYGVYDSSKNYVDGILRLRDRYREQG